MSKPLKLAVLSSMSIVVFCIAWSAERSRAPLTREQSVQSLVGTYQCIDDRDTPGQTSRFTSVNDAYGVWLRARVTYLPQSGSPGDRSIVFVGYDRAQERWNIVGVDADGSYWTRSSRSARFNGSLWINDHPRNGGKAVVRTYGRKRYTFDLTEPGAKGSPVRTHVVCTRT